MVHANPTVSANITSDNIPLPFQWNSYPHEDDIDLQGQQGTGQLLLQHIEVTLKEQRKQNLQNIVIQTNRQINDCYKYMELKHSSHRVSS